MYLVILLFGFFASADFADINGIKMYYETHGSAEGPPLVLLHGGGSTVDVTWGRILPLLAKNRKVIAIEEQGHGRTTDRDKPVRFETSADDVHALLKSLKIEKADLFGFSNGANVAMQVAIRHPQSVRKLIFASSITKKSGANSQLWEWIKKADFSNMPQPLKDAYMKVNPDEKKLRTMHDKDRDRMLAFKDVKDKDVKAIQAEALILTGDQDIVKPEHAVALTRMIPKSRLIVLLGGHGAYLGEAVMTPQGSRAFETTAVLVEEFLALK